MRTIAIDTSHAAGSVVARSDLAIAARPLGAAGEHAGRLAAALAEATGEVGWTVADAQLVAVVRGPGSFTGLRVGVATAKAVAWAGGAALLGVSGFEVVALETARLSDCRDDPLAIAYDAGRGEVFAAVATPASPGEWQVTPGVLQPADRWIESLPPGSRVTGPALASLADRLRNAGHIVAPEAAWFPTAAAAAELALAKARAGVADSPAALVPEYLRPSYAEEPRGAGRSE